MTNEHKDTAVRVCPLKDRECGDIKQAWCDTCPKRASFNEHKDLPALPKGDVAYDAGEAFLRLAHSDDQMRAYAREYGEQQRLEGRRDAHETNVVLLSENMKLKDAIAASKPFPAVMASVDGRHFRELVYYCGRASNDVNVKNTMTNLIAHIDAHTAAQVAKAEYGDAYRGAREDVGIWMKRALEAENTCSRLCAEFNAENGPTFMGEPAIAKAAPQGQQSAGAGDDVPYTYASSQATNCACCGEYKHTPLRMDAMGGYVCLTCIDKKLGSYLGEFGYPAKAAPAQEADEPKDWTPQELAKLDVVLAEYPSRSQEAKIRDAALEEAAQVLEKNIHLLTIADHAKRIRALKTAPAKPAQDLVAAIRSLHEPATLIGKCDTYREGFYKARDAAADLVTASLKGEKYQGSKS